MRISIFRVTLAALCAVSIFACGDVGAGERRTGEDPFGFFNNNDDMSYLDEINRQYGTPRVPEEVSSYASENLTQFSGDFDAAEMFDTINNTYGAPTAPPPTLHMRPDGSYGYDAHESRYYDNSMEMIDAINRDYPPPRVPGN